VKNLDCVLNGGKNTIGKGKDGTASFLFSFQMVIGQVKLYCCAELSESPAFYRTDLL